MAAPDILCLGEPMLEFNRQEDGRYLAGHGGDTSNVAVAAARQGAAVGMIAHLGSDAFGDAFVDLWAAEGVRTDLVRRDPSAHTAVYFVDHGPDGHRFTYLRKGSAASLMAPADVDRGAVGGARVLHTSGISQGISPSAADAAFEAMDAARSGGARVSYDTNLRPALWPIDRARAVIHAGMAMADIALPGDEDARTLTGLADPDAICDFYLDLGPTVVALTQGREGTLVATPRRRERVPAFPVEAVDATGAGDCFDGAFLARLVAGDDPFAAAAYANAAAALSTLGYGAVAPIPRVEAVRARMAA